MKKKWYEQKTTWTALAGVIGAVGGVLTGTIAIPMALQTVIGCVGLVFLRQGVEKSGK
jgi:hypothetical protein